MHESYLAGLRLIALLDAGAQEDDKVQCFLSLSQGQLAQFIENLDFKGGSGHGRFYE